MKKILIVFLACFSLLINNGCDSCDNENPSVQVINNGTDKADIQIKTSGGNTENINNILPSTASERRTFAYGNIVFTMSIQGVNDDVVYTLQTLTCKDYTVKINPDNSVSSSFDNRD